MSPPSANALDRWIDDLQARHLRDLTATEVARALRALSSTYVERRARLASRGAFDSAGKRAAYALYYAPRRYQTVGRVLDELGAAGTPGSVIDLGCGTGAAGAAWASRAPDRMFVVGVDHHPWALDETRATLRALGLRGAARKGEMTPARLPRLLDARAAAPEDRGFIFSYVVNELGDEARARLLPALIAAAGAGAHVLVVEPLSRRSSPWWPRWAEAVTSAGGRADEWRLRIDPPDIVTRLGRAAGLDPVEATCRTLWF
jgi:hypothetical protein